VGGEDPISWRCAPAVPVAWKSTQITPQPKARKNTLDDRNKRMKKGQSSGEGRLQQGLEEMVEMVEEVE